MKEQYTVRHLRRTNRDVRSTSTKWHRSTSGEEIGSTEYFQGVASTNTMHLFIIIAVRLCETAKFSKKLPVDTFAREVGDMRR